MAHARLASVLGAEFSSEEIEGVLQELERGGVSAETQLDAGIGVRRLVESGILVAPPRRARRLPPRAPARHRLPVGLGARSARRSTAPPTTTTGARIGWPTARACRRWRSTPRAAASRSRRGGSTWISPARARARHGYLDAELLYKNALENIPADDHAAQIAAAQGRAQMRYRLGRHEDAIGDYDAGAGAGAPGRLEGGADRRPARRGDRARSGPRLAARRGGHRGGGGADRRRPGAGDAGGEGPAADVAGARLSAGATSWPRRDETFRPRHRGRRAARRRGATRPTRTSMSLGGLRRRDAGEVRGRGGLDATASSASARSTATSSASAARSSTAARSRS